MDKEESRLRFTIASAIRDFAYYRDELVRLRDRYAHVEAPKERLETALNRLIDEISGTIKLNKLFIS